MPVARALGFPVEQTWQLLIWVQSRLKTTKSNSWDPETNEEGYRSPVWLRGTKIKISEEVNATNRKLGQTCQSSESAGTPRSGTSEVEVKDGEHHRLEQEFVQISGSTLERQPMDTRLGFWCHLLHLNLSASLSSALAHLESHGVLENDRRCQGEPELLWLL